MYKEWIFILWFMQLERKAIAYLVCLRDISSIFLHVYFPYVFTVTFQSCLLKNLKNLLFYK